MTSDSNMSSPPMRRVKAADTTIDQYTHRRPAKHQAEMELVARAFPALPKDAQVLDAPCGAGRMSLWMAQQGWQVSSVDLGEAAVNYTRDLLTHAGFDCNAREENIFHMPWGERSFQAVLCFRLLHHFDDPKVRALLLTELARVSDEHLLVSYLSPQSTTGIKRNLRKKLGGKVSSQNHTPLAETQQVLQAAGFKLVADYAQRAFFHSLHLAHFQRV